MGALFMSSETNIADASYTLLAWLEKNKSRLLAGLVGAIAIGVAVAVVNQKSRQAEIAAATDLTSLDIRVDAQGERDVAGSSDYLAVLEKHPDSAAAERALILLAGALFEEEDYPASAARFSEYLERYPEGSLQAAARLGKAACADAQGKSEQALGEYQTIMESFPSDPAADQAALARAYLLEVSGKPEDALKIYEGLAAPSSTSMLRFEAQDKQAHLLKRRPDLAPKELPSADAPPAGLNAVPELLQAPSTPAK